MALPKSRSYQMEAKMQEHTCTLTFSYPLMPVQSWLRPGTGSHRAHSWKSSSANVSIVFQQWGSQRVVLGCIHWFKFRSQVQALGTILYVYGNPQSQDSLRTELSDSTSALLPEFCSTELASREHLLSVPVGISFSRITLEWWHNAKCAFSSPKYIWKVRFSCY